MTAAIKIRRLAALMVATLVAILPGCTDGPTATGRDLATLHVSASVVGTTIQTIAVTVTAPDVSAPLVYNIGIANGAATGTIAVPTGSARTLTMRAFGRGVETHRGASTIDVRPEGNPAVSVLLTPLTGELPVSAQLASVVLTVSAPPPALVAPGDTFRLSGTVRDAGGKSLPLRVRWGSTNVLRATVDSLGLVTLVGEGEVSIVAAAGGVAVAVPLDVRTRWTSLSVGRTSCALRVGAAYCWGTNSFGQLGNGTRPTSTNRNVNAAQRPTRVSTSETFVQVATGLSEHTCALTADGRVFCWGRGSSGELGKDTTSLTECFDPYAEPYPGSTRVRCSAVPVLADVPLMRAIAVGGGFTCGIDRADGGVWCWGANAAGQLGRGESDGDAHWVPARVGSLVARQITLGTQHACVVAADVRSWCWGGNSFGELGSGTLEAQSATPLAVGGPTFERLSAGNLGTCGVTAAGEAHCWGANHYGQLGIGASDTNPHAAPARVLGSEVWADVVTGAGTACGVNAAGVGFCWGRDHVEQVGDGPGSPSVCGEGESSTACATVPRRVVSTDAFARLLPDSWHACAATASGGVRCWGDNRQRMFGDGTTRSSDVPVAAALLVTADVSARPRAALP